MDLKEKTKIAPCKIARGDLKVARDDHTVESMPAVGQHPKQKLFPELWGGGFTQNVGNH